jgi:hypothetical protein
MCGLERRELALAAIPGRRRLDRSSGYAISRIGGLQRPRRIGEGSFRRSPPGLNLGPFPPEPSEGALDLVEKALVAIEG